MSVIQTEQPGLFIDQDLGIVGTIPETLQDVINARGVFMRASFGWVCLGGRSLFSLIYRRGIETLDDLYNHAWTEFAHRHDSNGNLYEPDPTNTAQGMDVSKYDVTNEETHQCTLAVKFYGSDLNGTSLIDTQYYNEGYSQSWVYPRFNMTIDTLLGSVQEVYEAVLENMDNNDESDVQELVADAMTLASDRYSHSGSFFHPITISRANNDGSMGRHTDFFGYNDSRWSHGSEIVGLGRIATATYTPDGYTFVNSQVYSPNSSVRRQTVDTTYYNESLGHMLTPSASPAVYGNYPLSQEGNWRRISYLDGVDVRDIAGGFYGDRFFSVFDGSAQEDEEVLDGLDISSSNFYTSFQLPIPVETHRADVTRPVDGGVAVSDEQWNSSLISTFSSIDGDPSFHGVGYPCAGSMGYGISLIRDCVSDQDRWSDEQKYYAAAYSRFYDLDSSISTRQY